MASGKHKKCNIDSNIRVNYKGEIYSTEKYGDYVVTRELIGIGCSDRIFEVEFLNTGYKTFGTRSTITHGGLRDRSIPSVYGVGCIGNTYYITDPNMQHYYKIWSGMIERCYNVGSHNYEKYGAIGVKVSDDWLTFTNFYWDIRKLYGFENVKMEPNMYQLDKDYLQLNIPREQRIYSKETCMWISLYENNLLKGRDNNQTGYFGTRYDTGFYYTKIYNTYYGRFAKVEEAACLFNYIYPIVSIKPYCTLPMINNVPMIPFEELMSRNLLKNRTALDEFLNNNQIL